MARNSCWAPISAASAAAECSSALGTLDYMPPEQLSGDDVDWRSDVYSLGVVVYESLTGRVPFSADTPYSLMRKVMYEPPPRLSLVVPNLSPAVPSGNHLPLLSVIFQVLTAPRSRPSVLSPAPSRAPVQ